MSSVVKHYCDFPGCKAERAGDSSVLVFSHSQMCASGNGSDRWDAKFDLCIAHLFMYLKAVIASLQEGKKVQESPLEIVKRFSIHFEVV